MLRLLIVGCGDVVTRALPQLLRRYRIYALVRRADAAQCQRLRRLGVTPLLADLDQPHSLRRLAGLADHVVHSAPPQSTGKKPQEKTETRDLRTRRLLAALSRRPSLPRRLVYISTSGVYGDCQGAVVQETRVPRPQTARARRRLDAERTLRRWGRGRFPKTSMKSGARKGGLRRPVISILRAPGIYAADRLPLERLRRQDPVLCAADDVITNHIHADDLAQILCAALRHGRPQRIYNASDDTPGWTMGRWFHAIAAHFGLPPPPPLGREEARQQLSAQRLSFMNESRRLLNRRLKTELHVRLHYPDVATALAAMPVEENHPCSG